MVEEVSNQTEQGTLLLICTPNNSTKAEDFEEIYIKDRLTNPIQTLMTLHAYNAVYIFVKLFLQSTSGKSTSASFMSLLHVAVVTFYPMIIFWIFFELRKTENTYATMDCFGFSFAQK